MPPILAMVPDVAVGDKFPAASARCSICADRLRPSRRYERQNRPSRRHRITVERAIGRHGGPRRVLPSRSVALGDIGDEEDAQRGQMVAQGDKPAEGHPCVPRGLRRHRDPGPARSVSPGPSVPTRARPKPCRPRADARPGGGRRCPEAAGVARRRIGPEAARRGSAGAARVSRRGPAPRPPAPWPHRPPTPRSRPAARSRRATYRSRRRHVCRRPSRE